MFFIVNVDLSEDGIGELIKTLFKAEPFSHMYGEAEYV